MPSQVELCKLIETWLNEPEQQATVGATAEYLRKGYIDDPKAGMLYVIVTAGLRGSDRHRRDMWEKQADVEVTVLEKIAQRTIEARQTREDEITELHEAIENLLLGVDFGEYTRNDQVTASEPTQYSKEALYGDSVFLGSIPMTFSYYLKKQR